METTELLQRATDEAKRVVNGVTPDQLDAQTPCDDWKVRDLLHHVYAGGQMFAIAAEQGSVPDDVLGQLMGSPLPDDYRSAVTASINRAHAAFTAPGVADKTIQLPFGEMPGRAVQALVSFDLATHVADLARATGQSIADDEMTEAALALGRTVVTPDFRRPGSFDPEQPVADDAPAADRLLAFAGRSV